MKKLLARDMLEWTEDELWALNPDSKTTVVFDDATVDMNTVELQLSWYFWQVSKYYSQVPVTSDLRIGEVAFTDSVARTLMNTVIQSTRKFPEIDKEDVWKIVYGDIYNRCFCAISTRLLRYISGTSGDDVVELLEDPLIAAANEAVTDSLETVDHVYDVVRSVFESDTYTGNPIIRAIKYGTVQLRQMYPSFGPRGRVTDIDSDIYRRPVKRGFAMGFNSITDFAKESRSAAKALLFNKDPVATAEYFNRKLQFVAAYINTLEPGDCGTDEYHTLLIPEGASGEELVNGLDGLTQVHPDGSNSKIDGSDMSILGKSINFRTTLTCDLLPEQKVCTACYGDIAYSVPAGDNPGHVSCTSINEKLTQIIISTKHLDFIIHKLILFVLKKDRKYLTADKRHPDALMYNKELKGQKIVLRIYKKEAPRLIDVRYIEDTTMMHPSRTTSLNHVEFIHVESDGMYGDVVELDMVKRSTRASLSREFLTHAKKMGWEEDAKFYTIDMTGWNPRSPLFVYPHKHENMGEFGKRVERFIRSSNKAGEHKEGAVGYVNMLTRYSNVNSALYDAFYLIADKIKRVHIGHIATILAASRANDEANLDYSIPGSIYKGKFARHDDIIKSRSLGTAMQFEGHSGYFTDIDSFLVKDRLPGNLDDLIHLEEDKYPRNPAS